MLRALPNDGTASLTGFWTARRRQHIVSDRLGCIDPCPELLLVSFGIPKDTNSTTNYITFQAYLDTMAAMNSQYTPRNFELCQSAWVPVGVRACGKHTPQT